MNTANMSVISVAQPPLDPLGPSRSMVVLAATMLGFLAGVGIGGVRGAVDSLRDGPGSGASPRPAPRPSRARPFSTRLRRAGTTPETDRQTADEIDRIMRAAAVGSVPAAPPAAAPEAATKQGAMAAVASPVTGTRLVAPDPVSVASIESTPPPAAPPARHPSPSPEPTDTTPREESAMQPVLPYPYYPAPQGPEATAAQAWYEQQMAANAEYALRQAAMQQLYAFQQHQLAQPPYPSQPGAFFAGYAPPPYPPMPAVMPSPMTGAQPWPPHAPPPTPYQGWPQHPAAYPGHFQPAPQPAPAPVRAPVQAVQPEPSPVDEIRESLREFREAVRDLSERRARGRDY